MEIAQRRKRRGASRRTCATSKASTPELIAKLAEAGVHTRDDLADLAVDELTEITGQSADEAKTLIMKAREHWFAGPRVTVMEARNQHMSSTTVAEFAAELKKSPETLLEQLKQRRRGQSRRRPMR